MKKILLGLLVFVTAFVSCTEKNEIEISYGTNLNVSAVHLFDSFQPIQSPDEFQLSNYPGWKLNLIALIYDKDNNLVEKFESKSSSMSNLLSQELTLLPGDYKLVTIARFCRDDKTGFWAYWNISGEKDLTTLKISEVEESYMQFVFETLGIKTQEITVSEKSQNIDIEVPPVTGLVNIFFWGEDMTSFGSRGHSRMAPFCNEVNIWAPQLKQVVKFNGTEIAFDYGVQNKQYRIDQFTPKQQYQDGRLPNICNYRALLPISGRDFYWDISFDRGKGAQFGLNDYMESDYTEKINIESGKQYSLDLMFDGTYLFASEHVRDEGLNQRKERLVDWLNELFFRQIMNRNFDIYIGSSKSFIEETFGKPGLVMDNSLYYLDYNMPYIPYLIFGFDPETNTVKTISLMFQNITDDFRKRMTAYLTERFNVFEKGTDEHNKAFINGSDLQNSDIGVTWNLDDSILTYVKL